MIFYLFILLIILITLIFILFCKYLSKKYIESSVMVKFEDVYENFKIVESIYKTKRNLDEKFILFHLGNWDPSDYGFESFEEIIIKGTDNVDLSAWYMKANITTKKTLIMVHGRTSNRLAMLHYLGLVEKPLKYNILIPDLRNSGLSSKALTYMGYKFAQDIMSYIKCLNVKQKQSEFELFGTSMGAMAVAIVSYELRKNGKHKMLNTKIKISKIILSCPLSNVLKTIIYEGEKSNKILKKIFSPFAAIGFILNVRKIGGNALKLKLRYLLKNIDVEIIIFESKEDIVTPYKLLEKELKNLTFKKNIKYKLFANGEHVHVYHKNLSNQFFKKIFEF